MPSVSNLLSFGSKSAKARSGLLLSAVAAAGLLLSGVSASAQTTVAGVTPGSLAVDETGAANYRLPIEVPPGVAGLSPDLSLLYRHRKKNGILGVGWVLDGVSVIERCGRTIAQDGARGGINYDADDRFCLDNERLVSIAGTYGDNGAEYRTEIQSFSKIVSYGTAGNGPQSFKVWTKSGQILEYGNTADSRVEVPGQSDARYWALNKVSDRYGNEMTFSYAEDTTGTSPTDNTHKLTRIDYGGNTSQSTSDQASVRFTYEARTDTRVSYVAQARSQLLERMKTIETYAKVGGVDTLVKSYNLAYDYGIATGRSRLTSVTECDANGNCLMPHSFTYNDSAIYVWSSRASRAAPYVFDDLYSNVVYGNLSDVNGDGQIDMVVGTRRNNGVVVTSTRISTATGWATDAGYSLPGAGIIREFKNGRDEVWGELIDVNGDGLKDWVRAHRTNGTNYFLTYLNTGSGWVYTSAYNLPTPIENYSAKVRHGDFVDINGDGLVDWVEAFRYNGANTRTTWLNTGSGWQLDANYTLPDNIYDSLHPASRYGEFVDVNGDGLPDWVRAYKYNGTDQIITWLNTGSGWQMDTTYNLPTFIYNLSTDPKWQFKSGQFIDVNGDGLRDFAQAFRNPNGAYALNTWLSTGKGWEYTTSYNLPSVLENAFYGRTDAQFADLNNDGLPDFVVSFRGSTGGVAKISYLNTGSGWKLDPNFEAPSILYDKQRNVFQSQLGDVDGNGQVDWIRATRGSGGTYTIQTWVNTLGTPDLMLSATDSLGRVARVTGYSPLTDDSVYIKDSDATFPERDIQVPARVVSQISRDDGIGGQKLTNYTYAGGRYHDQGRKFLGFREMVATDVQTGNVTTTTYERDYRYSGFVKENKIAIANGALMEKTTYTWASTETVVANQPNIIFPYLASSTTERYEVNDGVNNSPLIVEVVNNTFDSYGNPTQVVSTTTGYPDGGGTETFETTTTNSFVNNTTDWLLGQRTSSTVAKSRDNGATSVTRSMSWAYDSTTGRVTQEVIEPGDANHELVRAYSYDAFGNLTGTTVSGTDIATRTTSATYDTNGLLMTSATNAEGHSETRSMDPRFGVTNSLTGPNALITTWLYDGFGRPTKELHADGTETQFKYELCSDASNPCATAPAGAVYRMVSQNFVTLSGTPSTGESIAYFDKLGREIRTETEGFDGTAVYVDSKYNARGLIEEVSRPYYAGTAAGSIKWTHTDYDVINRRLNLIEPDNRWFTTSYDGFLTVNTNPGGQVEDRIVNAVGELVSSEDHLNAKSLYSYDEFGNLISTDVEGWVTTMTYDLRGNRISMSDPDMGNWSYSYDVLGQLLTQTDAVNNLSTLTYDKLGRSLTRVEVDGITSDSTTTTWAYDDLLNPAAKAIGKVTQISDSNGYAQTQKYDSFGRPYETERSIAGDLYRTTVTYDAAGRRDTLTYPSNFVVQNNYNARGYLASVSEPLGGPVYWQANIVNAEGKVTQETFGNGVVTDRTYDPARNLVQSITSTSGANTIQELTFQFDQMGNLTERKDLQRDRTESFGYDNRNQLTSAILTETSTTSQLNSTTYSYDLTGNLTNKSDVGNYLYGQNGTGPHAVTTAGSNTYSYDANGSMTAGAGRVINWTAFRKPKSILDTTTPFQNEASFTYGPDRKRVLQVAKTGGLTTTTAYVGNTYERRTRMNQPDELVHYIRASDTVAIVTKEFDAGLEVSSKARYLHRDHIYSIESVTDETGTVTEHYSYDAHGKRRQSDWTAGLPSIPDETPRGFTGHEHLDGVGLVHMNGRVYEPTLGRFLSPDPYVQTPETPKGFNRYTYVFNNPLSFTDPSGFFAADHGKGGFGGGPGSEGNDGRGSGPANGSSSGGQGEGPGGVNDKGFTNGDPGDQFGFGQSCCKGGSPRAGGIDPSEDHLGRRQIAMTQAARAIERAIRARIESINPKSVPPTGFADLSLESLREALGLEQNTLGFGTDFQVAISKVGGRVHVEISYNFDTDEINVTVTSGYRAGLRGKVMAEFFAEDGRKVPLEDGFNLTAAEVKGVAEIGIEGRGAILGNFDVGYNPELGYGTNGPITPGYDDISFNGNFGPFSTDNHGRVSTGIGGGAGASAGVDVSVSVSFSRESFSNAVSDSFDSFQDLFK